MWSRSEGRERSRELDDAIGRDDSVIGWNTLCKFLEYDKEKRTNVVRSSWLALSLTKRWCFDAKAILTEEILNCDLQISQTSNFVLAWVKSRKIKKYWELEGNCYKGKIYEGNLQILWELCNPCSQQIRFMRDRRNFLHSGFQTVKTI